mmetsp:Transcript_28899/g.84480  ORF Transcript_28899/g.84480 Transcript_28899/m.84480 type:complete len:309 (+) Transcript_28899:571-1497(+)
MHLEQQLEVVRAPRRARRAHKAALLPLALRGRPRGRDLAAGVVHAGRVAKVGRAARVAGVLPSEGAAVDAIEALERDRARPQQHAAAIAKREWDGHSVRTRPQPLVDDHGRDAAGHLLSLAAAMNAHARLPRRVHELEAVQLVHHEPHLIQIATGPTGAEALVHELRRRGKRRARRRRWQRRRLRWQRRRRRRRRTGRRQLDVEVKAVEVVASIDLQVGLAKALRRGIEEETRAIRSSGARVLAPRERRDVGHRAAGRRVNLFRAVIVPPAVEALVQLPRDPIAGGEEAHRGRLGRRRRVLVRRRWHL